MSQTPRDSDLSETSPMARPDETTALSQSGGPPASPPATLEEAEAALQEASKSGTNIDTLVGRLVVDNGLATPEEVQLAIERARALREENNMASLVQIFLDSDYATKRQTARLKQVIEAERSGQKIPGYKILGKLGAGAMATVFKARQLSLDRVGA